MRICRQSQTRHANLSSANPLKRLSSLSHDSTLPRKGATMPKPSNPCSKWVEPEEAYEVWQSFDGTWTYFVLKKYQSPEKEATNPYARWFCLVKSPITPNGEYGDVYVATVKQGTRQIDNPLHRSLCVKGTSIQVLDDIGLSTYSVTELVL